MITLLCNHCHAPLDIAPLASTCNPLVGRCTKCFRPLADFAPHGPYPIARIGGYAIARLRAEHERNQLRAEGGGMNLSTQPGSSSLLKVKVGR